MSTPIGRNKAGELIRIYKNNNDGYNVEVGASKVEEFSSRQEAIKQAKVIMLKSFMPGLEPKNALQMLDTDVIVDYNFKVDRPSTYRQS